MKTKLWVLMLIGLLLLAVAVPPDSRAEGRKWAVGSFFAYNIPLLGLADRFSPSQKFGASWQYTINPKLFMEIEYHHSEFTDGKLVDKTFNWPVDGEDYLSPEATSEMKFNSVAVNLLIFYPDEPSFKAKDFAYYFEVGVGFYNYKAENRNFIYPGQNGITTDAGETILDKSLVLLPQINQRTSATLNAGFGVQAFISENLALDLRARYNMVIGDLRPMSDWGIRNKTFPMHLLDVGAGLKFYFWKQ